MSSYRIGVIYPSRGLAFSQTCDELLENLEGFDYEIYFAHGLSIPRCFNQPLERALGNKQNTHFFIIEDDMILPAGTLKALLGEAVPAIMCDYPMDAEGKAAIFRDPNGDVIYGGTGCLLVTRKFLEAYERPIFRTDTMWDIKVGEVVELSPKPSTGDIYGLHDVNFSLDAYRRGVPIKVSKVVCGHRKLKQLGAQATNQGQHQIETWTKLIPNKLPKPRKPIMVGVELDGEIINVRSDSPLAKDYKPKYVEFT